MYKQLNGAAAAWAGLTAGVVGYSMAVSEACVWGGRVCGCGCGCGWACGVCGVCGGGGGGLGAAWV